MAVSPQTHGENSRTIAYRPALDGIRALAVLAVMLYHGGVSWLPGGFLGVDAFFVLSGFLITSLLLAERAGTGRIRLGAFWLRRARRLLPALLVMLICVVAAYRSLLSTPELGLLRGDALAALGYVANWRMIYRGDDYFAQTATASPLQHTWSLGIEEQFYLLWPLIVVAVLALAATRASSVKPADSAVKSASSVLIALSAVGAVASAVAGALLFRPDDVNRAYFGTDARAQSLLVGCALAALLASTAARPRWLEPVVGVTGVAGVVVLGWMWTHATGSDASLFQGGLTIGGLAVVAVIAHTIVYPGAILDRALSLSPLVLLGRISYGVYLWHWPLFGLLTAERSGLRGPALLGLRVGVTLVIAAVSYVLIEQPIRTGQWPWRRGAAGGRRPRAVVAGATAVLAAVLTGGVIVLATVPPAVGAVVLPTPSAPAVIPFPVASVRPEPMKRPDRRPGAEPRIAFFGDSVAWTVAQYLAPQPGVEVSNRAVPGCGIARLSDIVSLGEVHTNYADCPTWDDLWRARMVADDPDVSVILLDRWELMDRKLNGVYQHVGDPQFDAYLTSELEHAVYIAGLQGAEVVLLTAPYTHRAERPDGGLYDEDQPARVDEWNRLLRDVAANHPDSVLVLDLNRWVCPDGRFTWNIGNLRIRSDGLHFTPDGVRLWVGPWLMPQLEQIARGAIYHVKRGD
jgi:peptidoglycan/LPS O-acetylase OafA/YrhL